MTANNPISDLPPNVQDLPKGGEALKLYSFLEEVPIPMGQRISTAWHLVHLCIRVFGWCSHTKWNICRRCRCDKLHLAGRRTTCEPMRTVALLDALVSFLAETARSLGSYLSFTLIILLRANRLTMKKVQVNKMCSCNARHHGQRCSVARWVLRSLQARPLQYAPFHILWTYDSECPSL